MITWIESIGLGHAAAWLLAHPLAAAGLGLLALFALAALLLLLERCWLLRLVTAFVHRSQTFWDEVLLNEQVFHRLTWVLPVLLIYRGIAYVPALPTGLVVFLQRLAMSLLVLVFVRALSGLFAGINVIYNRYPMAKHRPIKSYVQVVQIVTHLVGVIFIIAILINQSPWYFFSGLGAMMAVILLIFRDTLLSLVAGIQLTSNDLIRVGDWVEMPQFDADGDVIDIALNSVKIQNWDRTITVIPTHKFLEHSFKNWRGMSESGGRRIKRALHIDLRSIRFLGDDELVRLSRYHLLHDYLQAKQKEIAEYNQRHGMVPGADISARRLTNIGTFRVYIEQYLHQHAKIHQEMTLMVRQLPPTPAGLPLEIYTFSNTTNWVAYEGIQSDIFDHLLAIIPEFDLRVFQEPSGADLTTVTSMFADKV